MNSPVTAQGQRDELQELMAATYLPNSRMPYHGISHPADVRDFARQFCERLRQNGIHVDAQALDIGLGLHDALMHIKPELLGFRVAEELAGKLAYQFAKDRGLPELTARRAERVALATSPLYRPTTPEEIVARVSDLSNLPSSYEHFSANTQSLYEEAMLRSGQAVPFKEWLPRGFQYLGLFLWPMLQLTPAAQDEQGRSSWHTSALGNIARSWHEAYENQRPIVVEILEPGQTMRRWHSAQKSMWIGVQASERDRENLCQALIKSTGQGEVQLVVPGAAKVIPLPDGSADEVVLNDSAPEAIAEARRVLRQGGILHSVSQVGTEKLALTPMPMALRAVGGEIKLPLCTAPASIVCHCAAELAESVGTDELYAFIEPTGDAPADARWQGRVSVHSLTSRIEEMARQVDPRNLMVTVLAGM